MLIRHRPDIAPTSHLSKTRCDVGFLMLGGLGWLDMLHIPSDAYFGQGADDTLVVDPWILSSPVVICFVWSECRSFRG